MGNEHSDNLDLMVFCAKSANIPITIDETYPIGSHSIGIEGFYRPEDGQLIAILDIAFRRYFHGFRATVNIGSEEDGWYRYNARMTRRRQ